MKRAVGWLLAAILAGLAGCQGMRLRTDVAIDHYVSGRLAMERQEYELALIELSKAIQADPKLSTAHVVMGDIYRKRGDNQQAAVAYEWACQTNPYAFRPHYNLGVTYQLLAGGAKTAEAAAQCIRKAVDTYLRAIAIKPADPDTLLNLAACYYQQGRHDLAEQYCKQAIEANPKNPFAYSNLGIIYDAQNRLYEAVGAYKQSLELDTHQPKLILNLGSTYIRLNRLKDAINAYQLAAREDPKSAAPWEQIGTCHFYQRKLPEAVQAYETGVKLEPRSAAAHRGLGVALMAQHLEDKSRIELRDRALDEWNRALELEPNQADLLQLVRKYTPAASAPAL